MNKDRFMLVMQREYLSIVAKKSFIISTLLAPLTRADCMRRSWRLTDFCLAALQVRGWGLVSDILQAVLGINWFRLLGIFILYFIGGYLLYAALFAGFGSAGGPPREGHPVFKRHLASIHKYAGTINSRCKEYKEQSCAVEQQETCQYLPCRYIVRQTYHHDYGWCERYEWSYHSECSVGIFHACLPYDKGEYDNHH